MNISKKNLTCWVLTDSGKVGTENQCIGLALALDLKPKVIRLKAKLLWKYLPPKISFFSLAGLTKRLSPPWPDVVIAGGRLSVAPAIGIKRLNRNKTFIIQLFDPKVRLDNFDVVIAPKHDRLDGENLISTTGALHLLTKDKLNKGQHDFCKLLDPLPRPLVSVLIGGSSKHYRLEEAEILKISNQLKSLINTYNIGVAISVSRRTSPNLVTLLSNSLKNLPVIIWDGVEPNPYFGYLGSADYIIVTSDSISMISEACFTGKPVYIFELPCKSKKFNYFHQLMKKKNYTRSFSGKLESWSYKPLNELPQVTKKIKHLLKSFFNNL